MSGLEGKGTECLNVVVVAGTRVPSAPGGGNVHVTIILVNLTCNITYRNDKETSNAG